MIQRTSYDNGNDFESLVAAYMPNSNRQGHPPRLTTIVNQIMRQTLADRSRISDLRMVRIRAIIVRLPRVAEEVERLIATQPLFCPANLPRELWKLIFSKLNVRALQALRCLSHAWKEGVNQEDIFQTYVSSHSEQRWLPVLLKKEREWIDEDDPASDENFSKLVKIFFQYANERDQDIFFQSVLDTLRDPEFIARAMPCRLALVKVNGSFPVKTMNIFKKLHELKITIPIDKVILPTLLPLTALEDLLQDFGHTLRNASCLRVDGQTAYWHFTEWLRRISADKCLEYTVSLKTLEIHAVPVFFNGSFTLPFDTPRLPTVRRIKLEVSSSDGGFKEGIPSLNFHIPNLKELEIEIDHFFYNDYSHIEYLKAILENFTSLTDLSINFHKSYSLENIHEMCRLMSESAKLERLSVRLWILPSFGKALRAMGKQYGLNMTFLTNEHLSTLSKNNTIFIVILTKDNNVEVNDEPAKKRTKTDEDMIVLD